MKWSMVGAAVLCGCSGTPEPEAPETARAQTAPRAEQNPNAPEIQSEIGALDPEAAEAVVDEIRREVGRCFDEANAELALPVLGGDVDVVVRVRSDGSVRWAYPSASDIGHVGAEKCILSLHSAKSWPKPEGGEEGIARTHYGRDPAGRGPVSWSRANLGASGEQLAAELARCASQAGTTGLHVTVYVDPDGRVMAAGAAAEDEQGLEAIDCAVSAAKSKTFPSPGSYPAKATIRSR